MCSLAVGLAWFIPSNSETLTIPAALMNILCVPVDEPTVERVLKSNPPLWLSIAVCCPSVPLLKNSLDDCAEDVSFPSSIPFAPFAITSRFATVDAVPIETLPSAAMTKGVTSGFVLSSTTRAFPVPTCVILIMSTVVDPEAIMSGMVDTFVTA